MLRIAVTSLVLVVTAMLVTGCGRSGRSPAEAHLAALANSVCNEVQNMGLHQGLGAKDSELRAHLNSDGKLPRVATYVADAQASARSQATLNKPSYREYLPAASTLLRESSRLKRKVQSDLKALGWKACGEVRPGLGSP